MISPSNSPMSNRKSLNKQQADLSAAKRKLLEKWMRGEQAAEGVIPRRAKSESAPLSFAQERLWFLHHLVPDSAAYNICITLQLSGACDVDALRRALNEIVRRHEVLRAAFRNDKGK